MIDVQVEVRELFVQELGPLEPLVETGWENHHHHRCHYLGMDG
jgi:hypothetical protein